MVIIPAAHLRTQVQGIFLGHGASESIAGRLADSLVESNLVGHDSHGVLRVPEYGERIRAGTLKLGGAIEVVRLRWCARRRPPLSSTAAGIWAR
jgi:hydroxycarboxylate dehydrogenase B